MIPQTTRWRLLSMASLGDSPEALEILEPVAEVVELPPDQAVLDRELPRFDAYFATLRAQVGAELLANCPRLRALATASTGTNHIAVEAAEGRGIEVLSMKDDLAFLRTVTATAEHAWLLLQAANRRLPLVHAAASSGDWDRNKYKAHQLSGRTLGILGYGRLGTMMAEYGKAFRMRVLVCDRKPIPPESDVEPVDFATLLKESDYLSIHVHLTPENTRLFGEREFASMKRGAVLINTSRGALLDESSLLAALESGHLAAAGLDVIDGEWDENLAAHPVVSYARTHANLVLTPHVAGGTYESRRAAYAHTARKLRDFMSGLKR